VFVVGEPVGSDGMVVGLHTVCMWALSVHATAEVVRQRVLSSGPLRGLRVSTVGESIGGSARKNAASGREEYRGCNKVTVILGPPGNVWIAQGARTVAEPVEIGAPSKLLSAGHPGCARSKLILIRWTNSKMSCTIATNDENASDDAAAGKYRRVLNA
jgi:hypothetical protein